MQTVLQPQTNFFQHLTLIGMAVSILGCSPNKYQMYK